MKPLTVALVLEKQSFRSQVLDALKGLPVRVSLDQGGFGDWHLVREKLQRLQPDVILVDLGDQTEERFSYIQLVRTMVNHPAVVVIHDSGDAQIILQAMRAGAAEFLTVPLAPETLATALERISALMPGRQSGVETGGAVFVFLAAKGGAGATTLACNVAPALAKATKQDVLLADLDLETGNVAFAMKAASQYSILDACRNISRLDVHYWNGLVSNGLPGLHILTAPTDPRGLYAPQGVEIQQVLSFARSVYNFTIVDLASSLSSLNMAALDDADRTFLITTVELPCLHLANRTIQALRQNAYAMERLALVVNRSSRQDEVSVEDIERNLGVPVFWSFPSDATGVNEFYVKGGVIPAKSDMGKSIHQFVEKISGAKVSKGKKSFLGL